MIVAENHKPVTLEPEVLLRTLYRAPTFVFEVRLLMGWLAGCLVVPCAQRYLCFLTLILPFLKTESFRMTATDHTRGAAAAVAARRAPHPRLAPLWQLLPFHPVSVPVEECVLGAVPCTPPPACARRATHTDSLNNPPVMLLAVSRRPRFSRRGSSSRICGCGCASTSRSLRRSLSRYVL